MGSVERDDVSADNPGLPLTGAQLGIWNAQRLDPDSLSYMVGEVLEISGPEPLDVALLDTAIRRTIADTDTMRLRFADTADGPRQRITEPEPELRPLVDLRGETDPVAAAHRLVAAERERSATYCRAMVDRQLYTYTLLRLSDNDVWCIQLYHHLIIDGYSAAMVSRRVAAHYTALRHDADVPRLRWGSIETLVAEDLEYRASQTHQHDRDYWRDRLTPLPPLDGRGRAPEGVVEQTHEARAVLDADLVARIKAAATAADITWADVLVAGYAGFVHRVLGETDVVIALPVMARVGKTALTTPSMAVNVLPLRIPVSSSDHLGDLGKRVADALREVRAHQRFRGEDLAREFGGTQTGALLHGIGINLKAFDFALDFDGATGTLRNVAGGPPEDLGLTVTPLSQDRIQLGFEVDARSMDAVTVQRRMNALVTLITELVDAADRPLGAITLYPTELDASIAAERAGAALPGLPEDTVEVFDTMVAARPDEVVLVDGADRLTAADLGARVHRLARYLRGRGVGPEDIVGIALPRTADLVIALLAVRHAGAAFLMLDIGHPAQRLADIVDDAAPALILTDDAVADTVFADRSGWLAPTTDPTTNQAPANHSGSPIPTVDAATNQAPANHSGSPIPTTDAATVPANRSESSAPIADESSGGGVSADRSAALIPHAGAVPDRRAGALIRLSDSEIQEAVAGLASGPLTAAELAAPRSAGQLAYVVYTSGSTGKPKGVQISCGAMAQLLHHHRSTVYAAAAERAGGRQLHIAHTYSFAFDAALDQLLWLWCGHRIHLYGNDIQKDAAAQVAAFGADRIDVVDTTPSMATALIDNGLLGGAHRPGLLLLGGEATPPALWSVIVESKVAARNMYGPTEATVDALSAPVTGAYPHVGGPIPGTRAYLLDGALRLVPDGEIGELYLSGPQLARGYLGREVVTAERFVADPFVAGERMYRSGDRARWLPGHGYDYLGRADQQIKVRGYRVELGEVEASLGALPGVAAAAATLRTSGDSTRLVGYLVPEAGRTLDADQLRHHLTTLVPDHLVPSALVVLDALPITVNGKLDRAALPAPQLTSTGRAPRTDQERALCGVVAEVLGVARVNATDDFFGLGGDSITAIGVSSRLRVLGLAVPPKALLAQRDLATIAATAQAVEHEAGPSTPDEATGPVPIPPMVAALLAANPSHPAIAGYAQWTALTLHEDLSLDDLTSGLQTLLDHHDALRLVLDESDTGPTLMVAGVGTVHASDLVHEIALHDPLSNGAATSAPCVSAATSAPSASAATSAPSASAATSAPSASAATSAPSASGATSAPSSSTATSEPSSSAAPAVRSGDAVALPTAGALSTQARTGSSATGSVDSIHGGAVGSTADVTSARTETAGSTSRSPLGDALEVDPPSTAPQSVSAETMDTLIESVAADLAARLDPAAGVELRAALVRTTPGVADRLVLVANHLVVDGVSWRILVPELYEACAAAREGRAPRLSSKGSSWRRHAGLLAESGTAGDHRAELAHWEHALGAGPVVPLGERALDHALDLVESAHRTRTFAAPEITEALLTTLPAAYLAKTDEVLLAALMLAINAWRQERGEALESGRPVTVEGHGREPLRADTDFAGTIGWFTSEFPVWTPATGIADPDGLADAMAGGAAAGRLLRAVKEAKRAVPGNGVGYGVLRGLDPQTSPRFTGRRAPEVLLNYLGRFGGGAALGWRLPEHDAFAVTESPDKALTEVLSLNVFVHEPTAAQPGAPRLAVEWTAAGRILGAHQVTELQRHFALALEAFAAHARLFAGGLTPSDCPGLSVDQESIDALEATHGPLAELLALSPLQEGLLFHAIRDGADDVYTLSARVDLHGPLDGPRLSAAFDTVVGRHPTMAAAFHYAGLDQPVQAVPRAVAMPWREVDLSGLPLRAAQAAADRLEAEATRHRFAVDRSPMLRATLIRMPDDAHRLVLNTHHLVIDGWSTPIVLREVLAVYHGDELPSPARYSDYLSWIGTRDRDAVRAAWARRLAGFTEPTLVRANTFREREFRQWQVPLPASLATALAELGRRRGLTMNTLVQGTWALTLAALTGRTDVVFGATVSGRPAELPGVAGMVGLFANTVPVRCAFDPDHALLEQFAELQEQQFAMQEFDHAGLAEIERIAGTGTLFDTLVAFENFPNSGAQQPQSHELRRGEFHNHGNTHYPMTLIAPPGDRLELVIWYDRAAVLDTTLARISDRIGAILTTLTTATDSAPTMFLEPLAPAVTTTPDSAPGSALTSAPASAPNPTGTSAPASVPNPAGTTVPDSAPEPHATSTPASVPNPAGTAPAASVVEPPVTSAPAPSSAAGAASLSTVARPSTEQPDPRGSTLADWGTPVDPAAPAITAEAVTIDFREFDSRTNRLARWLVSRGVGPETVVAVAMPRTIDSVVTAHAICRAGGVYLPIDPQQPAQRIEQILETASPALVLHSLDDVDTSGFVDARLTDADRAAPLRPANTACLLFTSGSTGVPKGVSLTHAAIISTFRWLQRECRFGPGDTMLYRTPPIFDASLMEMLLPLHVGARIVLTRPGGHRDPYYQAQLMSAERVTAMWMTTSMLTVLAEEADLSGCVDLRCVLTGGEVLPPATAHRMRALTGTAVYNFYGPTEAAIGFTFHETVDADTASVPVGAPADAVRVLDDRLRPVPAGTIGELYMTGVRLARGYLARPDLSAGAFVADPRGNGERMYRTGDLVRMNPHGELDYVGRTDSQVKLRGQRIELGDIESALLTCAGVAQAVVLLREDTPGDQRLVAYLIAKSAVALDTATVREELRKILPAYMIPAAFVALDHIPRTATEKIARRELPAPESTAVSAPEPRSATGSAPTGAVTAPEATATATTHDGSATGSAAAPEATATATTHDGSATGSAAAPEATATATTHEGTLTGSAPDATATATTHDGPVTGSATAPAPAPAPEATITGSAPALEATATGYTATAHDGTVTSADAGPLDTIREAMAAVLSVAEIGADDDFFGAGGHSLLAVRLVGRLTRAGLPVVLDDVFTAPTPRGLATRIGAVDPRAPRPADGLASLGRRLDPVLELRAEGSVPPLFCIHQIGGTAWKYAPLARLLRAERPIIGLQMPQLTGREFDGRTLDDLARYYLTAIRRIQPQGPYHLLGYSLGGNLAHSVAAILEAEGEQVGYVGLLDSHPLSNLTDRAAATLADPAGMAALLPEIGEYAPELAAVVRNAATELLRMVTQSQSPRYRGPMALYCADAGDEPERVHAQLTGWKAAGAQLVIRRLPYSHNDIAMPTGWTEVAALLDVDPAIRT
ncbi:amino acid adenylation domain-containing protein [Nocardia sp. IBHARD005]|uniref:amino acid adenylation domain-containing protein n=1 Tax=Nocardia sp. IBHARD005 TaxID=3457765 RepID=UPI00405890E2